MEFYYDETEEKLPEESTLSKLLLERWYQHLDGGRKKRVIWDLALIQAILFPEWANITTITTSKDNGERKIHYYSSIQVKKMKEEFFKAMEAFNGQK